MTVTIGDRIKELRIRKGLAQADIEGDTATLSMISQVEENKALPSYNVLHQIADKLETTVVNLIGDSLPTIEVHLLYRIAKASALTQDYEVAVNMYKELLKREFGISKLQLMNEYAECLIAVSDPQQAVECLSVSLKSASDKELQNHSLMSHGHYTLGQAYLQLGNHLKAYKHFQRALVEISQDDDQDTLFVTSVFNALADLTEQNSLPGLESTVNNFVGQLDLGEHKQGTRVRDSYQRYLNEPSQRGV